MKPDLVSKETVVQRQRRSDYEKWVDEGQIDLFSLYVLFFHFRACDATRGNSFFQMSSYARANVRITIEK